MDVFLRHVISSASAKTKEVVDVPGERKNSLKGSIRSCDKESSLYVAVAGQFLFGVTLYGRMRMHYTILPMWRGIKRYSAPIPCLSFFHPLLVQPVSRLYFGLQIIKASLHPFLHC